MAIQRQGNALVCVASFLASGAGATGLAVSVDVYEIGLASGTPGAIVTAASATEIARGLYYYRLAAVNVDLTALYVFVFYTLGTADQKVTVQGWTAGVGWVENVDAAVSTRATQTSVDSRASQASVDAKASQSSVDTKASQASLDSFAATVGTEFDTVDADIATLTDVVQTEFTLVRAKTDQLLFNLAGKVEAAIVDAQSFAQAAADRVWSTAARTLTAGVDISVAGIQAVWNALTDTMVTVGSIGRYLTQELANSIGEDIADPLENIVPGAYESGTAGAALGRIGTGVIETVSPVSSKNLVRVTRGDDYLAVDGRAIPFTDLENMWTEPIASGTFTARIGGVATLTKAVLVSVGTGPGKQVLLELTSEETSALELGTPAYRFDIELVDPDGHKETPIKGRMNVEEDQTHA